MNKRWNLRAQRTRLPPAHLTRSSVAVADPEDLALVVNEHHLHSASTRSQ